MQPANHPDIGFLCNFSDMLQPASGSASWSPVHASSIRLGVRQTSAVTAGVKPIVIDSRHGRQGETSEEVYMPEALRNSTTGHHDADLMESLGRSFQKSPLF
jgi:hypothetical protein